MPSRWSLPAAFVASLGIHLLAGLAITSPWLRAPSAFDRHATIKPPPGLTPTPPRVGIERSRAVTVTWVGFETPTEHEARESEVEQAALTPASGFAELAAADPAPPAPPSERAGSAEPTPAELPPSRPSIPMDALAPVAIAPPTQMQTDTLEAGPASSSAAEPRVQRDEPAAPATPATPSQVRSGRPGIEDQRESDAAARQKPLKYTPGKPIAAEGIEITTVRPDFGTAVRMLANPQDPLVIIEFRSDGHVQRARFARSGTRVLGTGNPYVDGAILDAIYRWTARGAAIDALPEGQTLTYTVQLLLRG
ncbi:MAG: hypothetical protein Kow0022_05710 [Phycisphaerales bacterium]